MIDKIMKIIFLCTGNSCRSVLSEALFNARAPQGFIAYSAGSQPSGQIHPLTIKTLEKLSIETTSLWSKSLDDLEQFQPDIVITVCDSAAQESCPVYLASALKVHWGLSDPSHLNLPEEEKMAEFMNTVAHIQRRFDAFFSIDFSKLSDQDLLISINKIADIT